MMRPPPVTVVRMADTDETAKQVDLPSEVAYPTAGVASYSWFQQFKMNLGQGLSPYMAADALKRAGRTFLQSALAVVIAAGAGIISADVAEGAAVAGLAAVASLAQNALSK